MKSLLKRKLITIAVVCIHAGFLFGQNINHPNIECPGGVYVNSFNGNMSLERQDLFVNARKFDIDMTFYYNSTQHSKNYGYGNGWRFKFLMKYEFNNDSVTIQYPNGFEAFYLQDGNFFDPSTGVFDSLAEYDTDKYVVITKHRMKYFFDDPAHKRLTSITEPNGNTMTFVYQDSLITEVIDASGRRMQLAYNDGMLASITDTLDQPIRTVQYAYDDYGNLVSVTDPASNISRYKYLLNGPMNVVVDKMGNAVDIIYLSNYAVQEVISCLTNQRFSYNANSRTTTLVESVESGNQVTTYKYDESNNLIQKKGNCCGYNVSYEYDTKGNVSKMTDANGNETEYTYNDKGNMLSKKDAMGNTSYYTYEPEFNKIISYTNRNGNTTSYTYDNSGNLNLVAYPMGITNAYGYGPNGDLTSTIDGNGHTTAYIYNTNGNLIEKHHPLDIDHYFIYNDRGLITDYADPLSHSTVFEYDILDRLSRVTYELSHEILITYDVNDNLLTYTDRNNHTTIIGYDALNRPNIITNALTHSLYIQYDSKSNVKASIDANGNRTQYFYDNLNRFVSKVNAENEATSYDYDGAGNLSSITLPNGNIITYTYNELNRRTSAVDNIGLFFNRAFDNVGNILSQSDANGNTRSYSYDALNRRIGSTDPIGNSSEYSYDDNFNLITFTDRNNNVSTYSYDELNRLIGYTDALNNIITYTYNANGNLETVVDANNNSTSYEYDVLNRNTVQTFADATTNIYGYDNNGNVISITDNNGAVTNFLYDNIDRLITRDSPGSNNDVYTYDPMGRILSAINSNGTVTFNYDSANRMTAETLNGDTTTYVYDIANGSRTMIFPGGRTLVKELDPRNRLTEISDGNMVLASFIYDDANRLLLKNYSNGTFTSYNYDPNNRVISMITDPGELLNFEYGYDNVGNKLFEKKLHRPDHSEQYIYDEKYQLTEYKYGTFSGNSIPSPLHHNQYNYDALGNRTTVTEDSIVTNYTINNMNAYTSINGAITIIPLYDNNGNLIDDGTFTYSYDTQNRLIMINNGAVASYKYDALGRRIQKEVDNEITNFVYSGVHEIETHDESGNILASYVFGPGIDNVLSAKINNIDYYYYKNVLGSINAIAGNSGTVMEHYEYDPFGKVHIFDNNYNLALASNIENTIYFTGRTFDTEIDKYYYRYRHYDQMFGRFIQHDPLKYIDGLNMYVYVKNNVLNSRDPFGTDDEHCVDDNDVPSPEQNAFPSKRQMQEDRTSDLSNVVGVSAAIGKEAVDYTGPNKVGKNIGGNLTAAASVFSGILDIINHATNPELEDHPYRETGKAVGEVGGGFVGAEVGSIFGGLAGSFFPGPGTVVGAVIGGAIGGAIGKAIGGSLGTGVGCEIEGSCPGGISLPDAGAAGGCGKRS